MTNTPFPITHRTGSKAINGHQTDVVISEFSDKIFIVVSQCGRLGGQMLLARRDGAANPFAKTDEQSISVKTLLGRRDDPLSQVYASHILNKLSAVRSKGNKDLLLSLALKSVEGNDDAETIERSTFEEIINLLEDLETFA
ncbi:hypothetical protein HDU76_006012 [Blyttiomyces sp. JEL0837]|nr:hypothetical protein HDU76_006012 [Blyttiomyces sp. JEL0837]